MQATAIAPVIKLVGTGASRRPTRPVKTTSDITLGFSRMA